MKIHFHGAAQTVTGSMHLLEINGARLLLECGLFQGRRGETYTRNQNFPFQPSSVDAVILSHAHIDHSGNLPNLVKQGFTGKIFCTPPSRDLAEIMLLDSGHIQEADVMYINKKRARRGEPLLEPLYTLEDADRVRGMFQAVPYGQPFEPVPGVIACFVDAGHILGSAGVVLDLEEKGVCRRLWFSGDIGRLKLPLLRDPVLPEKVDYLVMETTYGDKPHRDPQQAYDELREVLNRTIRNGGKVIIPAFAVGRTQELIYDLNQMIFRREVPPVPVYVDSPLAVSASDIFQRHLDYFDEETRRFVSESRHPALNFRMLTYVRTVEESKLLNNRTDPMIIISASGMAETGRILHHLKNNIENPRNTILIVSWQAPDTLGRRLAERAETVKIFGETYRRRAEVVTIGGLSAHAGQDFLLKYALASRKQIRQVFLVHGEPPAAMALQAKLADSDLRSVAYPGRDDVAELT
jgi:metallo-beta-lactamase family protein